jgi:predicted MFS family arabinose efflux permease
VTIERNRSTTRLPLAVLCLAAAINLLQSASLSPLLPSISAEFGTPDAATGQLATLGSLVGFGFSLAATPWMDRLSRRTWFRLEGTMIIVGMLLAAFAPSFLVIALGRILAASGASLIMANCMTGAREIFPNPRERNRAIGLIVSASTLVFIIGLPAITQIEARYGWRMAFLAIILPTLVLLIGTFALPETRSAHVARPIGGPLAAFGVAFTNRRVAAFLVVLGLISAIYAGWFVYFGAFVTSVYAVSASVLSILFLLGGASQLVANNVAPLLMRRFNPLPILFGAVVVLSVSLLLTGIVVVNVPTVLIAAMMILNGCGTAYIATNVLLLDSEVSHPGAVMSIAAATGSLGAALGPFITGVALASTGSFDASYRILGLLAPLTMAVAWLGTRRDASATAQSAATLNSAERGG